MNLIEQIKQAFNTYLQTTFSLDPELLNIYTFELNIDPAKKQFGDINTNAAMVLTKYAQKNPREIAQTVCDNFSHEQIEKIEIAGPGFLNLHLKPQAFSTLLTDLSNSGHDFFKLTADVPKKRFNVEFVSANPTGPLHLGHGRGGIIGDVLANILNFIGHHATKEFYINDAGAQIKKLGTSFKIRCQQAAGQEIEMPEDGYHGQYLVDLAKTFIDEQPESVLEKPETFFGQHAKTKMLEQLKTTLANYGIAFDVWFSELSLHTDGAVDRALDILQTRGHLYEKDGALWFKSTTFGDDKDRVLKKSSGDYTYVTSDVAYMEDKEERKFDVMIMVLGHDHHSYGIRLEGLRQALGLQATLNVILFQLVKMKASGQMVRMSKRAGNIVTLQGIIDEVGVDVARFFYLNRKADAQLEFDLDLALKKTEENPVYYVQYAYVRTHSILNKATEHKQLANITNDDAVHIGQPEQFLIKKIVSLKQMLENISGNYHTHILTYYVIELANAFHSYYGNNRVIDLEHVERSRGRLLLITQLRVLFGLCLGLLGISKPEKM